jgi:hypothetical protein
VFEDIVNRLKETNKGENKSTASFLFRAAAVGIMI